MRIVLGERGVAVEERKMLVLSRAINESILVGETIRIEIEDIQSESVRLLIDCPPTAQLRGHGNARENNSSGANSRESGPTTTTLVAIRVGKSISIGENVIVWLLMVRGEKVRIGVEYSTDLAVQRL